MNRPLKPALPSNRDTAIDAIRGVCIFSMMTGHLAEDSRLYTVTHELRWVDGAYGFVLLSGLVLGIVHNRVIARNGLHASWRKLSKRVGVIYIAHLATLGVALAIRAGTGRPTELPTISDLGGTARALINILTLKIQPENFDILAMYVFLLALAIPVVWLLHRRLTHVVLACSAAVYVYSQLRPAGLRRASPAFHRFGPPWNIGAWQMLFVVGLVAGWHWQAIGHLPRRINRSIVGASILCVAVLVALIRSIPPYHNPDSLFVKAHGGFVPMLLGTGVFTLAYCVLKTVRLRPSFTAPVELIGRHSLGCVMVILIIDPLAAAVRLDRTVHGRYVSVVSATIVMYVVSILAEKRRSRVGQTTSVALSPSPA
ncbi:MAG: OpgC domain-containing protein [Acidimicrobiia bacterium]